MYICKVLVDMFLLDSPQEKGGTMLVKVSIPDVLEAKKLCDTAIKAGNRCVVIKDEHSGYGIIDINTSYRVNIYGRGLSTPKAENVRFLYKYRDIYGYLAEATIRWKELETMHPAARLTEETRMGWRE